MKKWEIQCVIAIIILIVVFASNKPNSALAVSSSVASVEETDCATFEESGLSEDWQCGYLIVPENRSDPQSRSIKVAFAVQKATGENPQPDALVYLTGGPGLNGIEGGWNEWRTESLKNRDLILVDPRGVGFSQPLMDCPANTPADASGQEIAPSAEERNAQFMEWAQSCRERLVSAGFDLTAYNSKANAHDLEDLRIALGYDQWNLYGISYGTRTALYTMRLFPDGIRSTILDSVLPPQVDRIGGDLITTAASFSALIAACNADPVCDREYPNLETKLHGLIQRLDAEPMKITNTDGRTGEKKQIWVASDRDAFALELDKYPELKPRYATYPDAFICPTWDAGQADATGIEPVKSNIPTLILNGNDFDSATPPSFAQLAASTLSNSHLFIFSKYTHAVSNEDCPKSMMVAFLEDPSRAPDSFCIEHMDGLPFIADV